MEQRLDEGRGLRDDHLDHDARRPGRPQAIRGSRVAMALRKLVDAAEVR